MVNQAITHFCKQTQKLQLNQQISAENGNLQSSIKISFVFNVLKLFTGKILEWKYDQLISVQKKL